MSTCFAKSLSKLGKLCAYGPSDCVLHAHAWHLYYYTVHFWIVTHYVLSVVMVMSFLLLSFGAGVWKILTNNNHNNKIFINKSKYLHDNTILKHKIHI